MTPEDFVSCIRREILEVNLALYSQDFGRPLSEPNAWPRMTKLYQSLTEEQQAQFMEGIRQVMVDTLSNVLGILDGSTLVEHYRGSFRLTYDNQPQKLNG